MKLAKYHIAEREDEKAEADEALYAELGENAHDQGREHDDHEGAWAEDEAGVRGGVAVETLEICGIRTVEPKSENPKKK